MSDIDITSNLSYNSNIEQSEDVNFSSDSPPILSADSKVEEYLLYSIELEKQHLLELASLNRRFDFILNGGIFVLIIFFLVYTFKDFFVQN